MSNVKVHPDYKELESRLLAKAAEVGLDQIDFDGGYSLTKIESKRTGGIENGLKLRDGKWFVVGGEQDNGEFLVCFLGVRYNGERLRTSGVVSVEVTKIGYKIHTLNSVYELRSFDNE